MAEKILRTGKQMRAKSAVKGKRFRCAMCRRRSPKPVKTQLREPKGFVSFGFGLIHKNDGGGFPTVQVKK